MNVRVGWVVGEQQRIWVDLANSPQVLFFRPLIRLWQSQGRDVVVTSRPFAQTVGLCNRFGLVHESIGRHGGRTLMGLGGGVLERAVGLAAWARGRGIDIAVSHNSYAQLIAARLLGIPAVTTMDYEHQPANHLAFRLAQRVVVPAVFPEGALRRFGAAGKVRRYSGLKEEVYLADFVPSPDFREKHGLRANAVLVVVRPAADWALYHRFENPLVPRLLEVLGREADVDLVFLPRIREQVDLVRRFAGGRVIVPETVWDGPALLWAADAVFSAGGTMAREGAVLGTPTYTLFGGRGAAVDRHLIETGRLRVLRDSRAIAGIALGRKLPGQFDSHLARRLLTEVATELLGGVTTATGISEPSAANNNS